MTGKTHARWPELTIQDQISVDNFLTTLSQLAIIKSAYILRKAMDAKRAYAAEQSLTA